MASPDRRAFQQLLAKLQAQPTQTRNTGRINAFNTRPEEYCLCCQSFAKVLAKCQHCNGPYCSERCKKQDDQVHVCSFNYIVEASLMKVKHPSISRTVTIPYTATFEELHETLRIAFSWHPTTNYEFCFGKYPKILVASSQRITTLALIEEEKAKFDDFRDGSTTYIVEAMRNIFADRRIMGYSSDASSQLVHCVKIRAAPRSLYSEEVSCIGGIGHPFADGFDLDEWEELKKAYDTRDLTQNQKALVEMYEIFCPNSNPHGLCGGRVNEFSRDAVNAELKMVSVALKTFPDSFRRRWLGAEDQQSGKNEQASQEDQPSLLEQAFKELSLDSPGAW